MVVMQLGDNLGFAGLIIAVIGIGVTILWPTKRWIGYGCFVLTGLLGICWGVMAYQSRHKPTDQSPNKAAVAPPKWNTEPSPTPSVSVPKPQKQKVPVAPTSQPHVDVAPTQSSPPTVVVQPGAVASFGQQGGITAGQVIISEEEDTRPITLDYSQEPMPPPHPGSFPYALRVTVKPNRKIESTSLAMTFDGPVEIPVMPFSCMSCGNGRINNTYGSPDLNTAWIFWSFPTFTPDRPAVFVIESVHPVKLLSVSKGPEFSR
jgi:hypothetical protein